MGASRTRRLLVSLLLPNRWSLEFEQGLPNNCSTAALVLSKSICLQIIPLLNISFKDTPISKCWTTNCGTLLDVNQQSGTNTFLRCFVNCNEHYLRSSLRNIASEFAHNHGFLNLYMVYPFTLYIRWHSSTSPVVTSHVLNFVYMWGWTLHQTFIEYRSCDNLLRWVFQS